MAAPDYPGIGEIGRLGEMPEPPRKEAAPEESEVERLRKRAEEAEARERAANEALQKSVGTQRPTPPPARKASPPAAPPKPGKMPDPATKPDEFEAWQEQCREWDRWENRQHVEQVRSTESSAAASARVIDGYIMRNPKFAPLRSHVVQCYHEAAVEMGLSEIPEDTRELDELAHKKLTILVNTAAKASDLPTGDPSDDEDADRTGGLSGGSTSGPMGGDPPKEEDGVPIKSMFDVMRERQAKSGLF